MSDSFWVNNPNILIQGKDIWPTKDMNSIEKYNAISRLIFILTAIGYIATKSNYLILVSFISLGIIVYLHDYNVNDSDKQINISEGFLNDGLYEIIKDKLDSSTPKNPFSNVMLDSDVDKKIAPPAYNDNVKNQIKKTTMGLIKDNNKDNKEIDKLFRDTNDENEFDQSLRNFYSTPNTQIPNDQAGFVEFCYGNLAKK